MRAGLLQRQIKLNEQVLTQLHEELRNLRNARKMYNERADECFMQMMIADDLLDFDTSHQHNTEGEANREQASVYTPYILKFKRKIEKLSQVQKALKTELKCQQALEMWSKEDDAFWLEQAKIAQEGGYATPDSVDALFVSFPQEDV